MTFPQLIDLLAAITLLVLMVIGACTVAEWLRDRLGLRR